MLVAMYPLEGGGLGEWEGGVRGEWESGGISKSEGSGRRVGVWGRRKWEGQQWKRRVLTCPHTNMHIHHTYKPCTYKHTYAHTLSHTHTHTHTHTLPPYTQQA